MPLKSYRVMFKEVRSSKFLFLQSLTLFLITYIDWTLIPYVTKLEGTYLPVYMISLFMLLGALDGFVQPLFKHIKIYNIYLFTIVLDIIQMISYSLINISLLIFTYIILIIFTIQGITFEIARVHTVDFMQDEAIELKDYLMLRSFVISFAIVCGSTSAMVFDAVYLGLKNLLVYLSILGIISILIQIKLYNKFKLKIYSDTIELEKDKRELYEKFRN